MQGQSTISDYPDVCACTVNLHVRHVVALQEPAAAQTEFKCSIK